MLLYYYGISSSSTAAAAAVGAGEDADAAGNSPTNHPHVAPRTHGDTRGMGVWGLSPITTARSWHGGVFGVWICFPFSFFFFYSELSGFYCKAPNFPSRFPACNNISNPPLLGDSQRLQEEGGL